MVLKILLSECCPLFNILWRSSFLIFFIHSLKHFLELKPPIILFYCEPVPHYLQRPWPSQQTSKNSKVPSPILGALQDNIRTDIAAMPIEMLVKERMTTSENGFAIACWMKDNINQIKFLKPINLNFPNKVTCKK